MPKLTNKPLVSLRDSATGRPDYPQTASKKPMRIAIILILLLPLFLLPPFALGQDDENWPPLSYLRSDYKAVVVVTHIRIHDAEITGRVGGYENWKIVGEVLESFKGKFRKGDTIEYFHGAEAGMKKELFTGEKIVFLLADYDKEKKAFRYSVLENSTLPPNADRLAKLRTIMKSSPKKRSRGK